MPKRISPPPLKCKSCFYFKRKFPFDFDRGIVHYDYHYCTKLNQYIWETESHLYCLKITEKPNVSLNQTQLYPISFELLVIGRWEKYYKVVPFTPDSCKFYLSQKKAIDILTKKEGIEQNECQKTNSPTKKKGSAK